MFFETPHRSTDARSWESLANWLLFVSDDKYFNLGAIKTTAKMMRSVCTNFKSSERLYRIVNIYYKPVNVSHYLGAGCINWNVSDKPFEDSYIWEIYNAHSPHYV